MDTLCAPIRTCSNDSAHSPQQEMWRNLLRMVFPVMANSTGLVLAYARGMNQIMLRLPRELQQEAIDEIGRFDPSYGEDWGRVSCFWATLGITFSFRGSARALDSNRISGKP